MGFWLLSSLAMASITIGSHDPAFARRERVRAKSAAASLPSGSTKSKPAISAEELFRRYSPAVVRIELRQHGVPISVGAGFFVSDDGALVTNHHVARSAIGNSDITAEFTLHDKRVIREFKVASCGDERNVDLCLLKLPVKPKSHFTITDRKSVV